MKLRCPKDPEHKEFVMTAMVPETWILDEDGDCIDAMEATEGAIEADLNTARCQVCSVLVVIEE
jgi:hypothetical protein